MEQFTYYNIAGSQHHPFFTVKAAGIIEAHEMFKAALGADPTKLRHIVVKFWVGKYSPGYYRAATWFGNTKHQLSGNPIVFSDLS